MTHALRWKKGAALALGTVVAVQAGARAADGQILSPSYAVVIGITDYRDPQLWRRLDTAVPDARAVQALLQGQGFAVTPLFDAQATRANIISTLRNLARKIETDRSTTARVVVYFAGHGATETVAGTDYGYLVPWDGTNDSSSYVSMDDVRDVSQRLSTARHQLYLLDSCFGGLLVTRDPSGMNANQPGYLQDAIKRPAIQVITAGGKDQSVVSTGPGGHSPFTGALLEALGTDVANTTPDGVISYTELVAYIVTRAWNRYQTPGYGNLPSHGQGEFLFKSPSPRTRSTGAARPIVKKPVLRSGPGPEPADAKTRESWRKCNAGDAGGCTDLGNAYGKGSGGLPRDMARAAALYQQACDGGHMPGCNNLANYYEKGGGGLPRNPARAVALYQTACNGGDMSGCYSLGRRYESGESGLVKDPARAVILYQQACDGGHMPGCSILGDYYMRGGGGLPRDPVRAVALYQRACDGGHMLRCVELGHYYRKAVGDSARAVSLYRQACNGGEMLGCSMLGFTYEYGEGGLPKDPVRAIALYQKTCDAGEPYGCAKLGACYESGKGGLRKDLVRAVALYQKACDAGNGLGCDGLKRLRKQ